MRSFPSEISGFVKIKGVPAEPQGKAYFSSWEEAVSRCNENPFCMGVSNQRIFVGTHTLTSKLATEKGQPGESNALIKKGFEAVFCR